MTFFKQIIGGRDVSLSNGHMPQFLVGLDASKPANPGKGDTYYASDTTKIYTCLISGAWSLTSSPCKVADENQTGATNNAWLTAVSGNGSATTTSATATMDLSTGITLAGTAKYYFKTVYGTALNIPLICNIQLGAFAAGTPNTGTLDSYIGFKSQHEVVDTILAACFHQKSDGTWETMTAKTAGSNTVTPITTPGQTAVLTVELLSTAAALFYVDGVLVATHTTNLPDGSVRIGVGIDSTDGVSVARTLKVYDISYERLL